MFPNSNDDRSNAKNSLDGAHANASGTTAHAKQHLNEMGQATRDFGKASSDLAHDAVKAVQENAQEYYKDGLDQAKKMERNLEDQIRNHPLRSLLIASGIGLVLGALWTRR